MFFPPIFSTNNGHFNFFNTNWFHTFSSVKNIFYSIDIDCVFLEKHSPHTSSGSILPENMQQPMTTNDNQQDPMIISMQWSMAAKVFPLIQQWPNQNLHQSINMTLKTMPSNTILCQTFWNHWLLWNQGEAHLRNVSMLLCNLINMTKANDARNKTKIPKKRTRMIHQCVHGQWHDISQIATNLAT